MYWVFSVILEAESECAVVKGSLWWCSEEVTDNRDAKGDERF